MGTTQKPDGRYVVGKGIENANNYDGSMGYRDIVIQLTESGATEDSVKKLEYLRDYAEYHSEFGEPIVPPNVQVWISGSGYSKVVEADDIEIGEDSYTICGIVYTDGAWDYTNAGQGSGGGSDLPEVTSDDNGDVLTVVGGAWAKAAPAGVFDIIYTYGENDTITCNKTGIEIAHAYAENKYLSFSLVAGFGTVYANSFQISGNDADGFLIDVNFCGTSYFPEDTEHIMAYGYSIEQESISGEDDEITILGSAAGSITLESV